MIFVLPLLIGFSSNEVKFVGAAPGPLFPSTIENGGIVDPKRVAAYVEVPIIKPEPSNYAGLLIPSIPCLKSRAGYALVAIPFAASESHRRATLRINETDYRLLLPVSHDLGPTKLEAKTFTAGNWTATVDYTAPKHSFQSFGPRLTIRGKTSSPYTVEMGDHPVEYKGMIMEGPWTFPMRASSSKLTIRELDSQPIRIRVSKTRSLSEYFTLEGKKLYSTRNHSVDPQSSLYALKFRKTVFGKERLSDVPRAAKDGDIIEAVAFRLKKGEPTILHVDSGSIPRVTWRNDGNMFLASISID